MRCEMMADSDSSLSAHKPVDGNHLNKDLFLTQIRCESLFKRIGKARSRCVEHIVQQTTWYSLVQSVDTVDSRGDITSK
eukprot:scaffold1236_cov170-Ochromonas_danica.AAC.4